MKWQRILGLSRTIDFQLLTEVLVDTILNVDIVHHSERFSFFYTDDFLSLAKF